MYTTVLVLEVVRWSLTVRSRAIFVECGSGVAREGRYEESVRKERKKNKGVGVGS